MISHHISPALQIRMENGDIIKFKHWYKDGYAKPKPEKCKGKITGILLAYAFCGEQDFGIESMANAFGASIANGLVIEKVPVKIVERFGVKVIKYNIDYLFDSETLNLIGKAGMVGCWDDESIAIYADEDYNFVIDEIADFLKPNEVKFAFSDCIMGREHLLIVKR